MSGARDESGRYHSQCGACHSMIRYVAGLGWDKWVTAPLLDAMPWNASCKHLTIKQEERDNG